MMRMITIRCALLLCVSAAVCCADPNNPEPPREVEVSAPRLNDAVQAVAEAYKFFWEEGEEVYIDKTVSTMNYTMAMVYCHVHHGYLADRGFMLRFERLGDKWVLKAFAFTWFS